jgi:hypothetical protein
LIFHVSPHFENSEENITFIDNNFVNSSQPDGGHAELAGQRQSSPASSWTAMNNEKPSG